MSPRYRTVSAPAGSPERFVDLPAGYELGCLKEGRTSSGLVGVRDIAKDNRPADRATSVACGVHFVAGAHEIIGDVTRIAPVDTHESSEAAPDASSSTSFRQLRTVTGLLPPNRPLRANSPGVMTRGQRRRP